MLLGVYGRKPANGGYADELRIFDGTGAGVGGLPANCTNGTGPADFPYSAIYPVRKATLPTGISSYTYYFVVGSLAQVRNDMVTLYNSGF